MDLNVCIESSQGIRDSSEILRNKLERCKQLGFHTVAVSVCTDISEKKFTIPPPPTKESLTYPNLRVYTRLTVKVSETAQLFKLSKSPDVAKYDLLALEPQNNTILQYIANGSADLDILTLDLSETNIRVSKIRFSVLQTKGVCIEINYGPAQLSSSMRRNIICNGQNLAEKINTSSLILSSGVQDIFRLRSPMDAQSLGVLFMIPYKKCHDIVYKNGQKALQASKHRKNPVSSAIELVKSG